MNGWTETDAPVPHVQPDNNRARKFRLNAKSCAQPQTASPEVLTAILGRAKLPTGAGFAITEH